MPPSDIIVAFPSGVVNWHQRVPSEVRYGSH